MTLETEASYDTLGIGAEGYCERSPRDPALSLKVTGALLINEMENGLFVTSHECHASDEGISIGIGRPVPPHEVLNILGPVLDAPMEWLPPNLLAHGPEEMCWWVPPSKRSLWFRVGQKNVRYKVPLPGLVLSASRTGRFRIFATKRGRPGPDTPLFHAPLMNINSDGFMCFGNVVVPAYGVSKIPEWEAALFDTVFVHVNHFHTLDRDKEVSNEMLRAFWRGLRGKDVFPESALAPTDQKPWARGA